MFHLGASPLQEAHPQQALTARVVGPAPPVDAHAMGRTEGGVQLQAGAHHVRAGGHVALIKDTALVVRHRGDHGVAHFEDPAARGHTGCGAALHPAARLRPSLEQRGEGHRAHPSAPGSGPLGCRGRSSCKLSMGLPSPLPYKPRDRLCLAGPPCAQGSCACQPH